VRGDEVSSYVYLTDVNIYSHIYLERNIARLKATKGDVCRAFTLFSLISGISETGFP
jgi:hypothetical protein